ncbi:MAG: hypothetical protein ACHQE6_00425 [Solirubrobacterales bacterium]
MTAATQAEREPLVELRERWAREAVQRGEGDVWRQPSAADALRELHAEADDDQPLWTRGDS